MKVITVSNVKGGVCKTTTAATLAAGLNNRGEKVLLIDSDPQMNLTLCFFDEPTNNEATLYNLYNEEVELKSIIKNIRPGLDIVFGDFGLCSADMEFFMKVGSLRILTKALKELEEDYSYVIIDTPPNLGFLSLNAFMASDYILTPMAADSFSLKAIRLLKKTLNDVSEEAGKDIPVLGVLLTKYTGRTNVAKLLEENINSAAELLETTVFESRIRQATVVLESQLAKMDLFEYAPKAPVTLDYNLFIDEILNRIGD